MIYKLLYSKELIHIWKDSIHVFLQTVFLLELGRSAVVFENMYLFIQILSEIIIMLTITYENLKLKF